MLAVALALQALATLASRAAPRPGPELLALLAEHALWSLGALRLRPGGANAAWRLLRVPLWGAFAGVGFALLSGGLARALPPGRSFFELQALLLPEPGRAGFALVGGVALATTLRFTFAYALRAVWLEGRLALRWRLTALALVGGVVASSLVAVLPGLIALARDPGQRTTGAALRDARALASSVQLLVRLGLPDARLRPLLAAYLAPSEDLPPRPGEPRLDAGTDPYRTAPGETAVVLRPDEGLLASSRPVQPARGAADPWAEPRATAETGRCRASVVGLEVYAACPVAGPAGRVALVAGISRPVAQGGGAAADLVAQLATDLTRALDVLSQAFLPVFLGLGLIGYLVARRLTGRLDALLDGAVALSGGRLDVRVPVQGEDEVARLAGGFNRMADRLEENVAALSREKAQVESLLRANRTLTASASHELRTPVSVMRAHLESAELRGEPLGPEEARVLAAEVARLERLVEDLFALSRAELGQLEVRPEAVDLRALAEELLAALGPVARSRGVSLVQAVPADLPRALADRARLMQAVVNLAHNALRYTPQGGIVMLEGAETPGGVSLGVRDTGIGIGREDLERVFEPFYRADPARARETGGSGLGLALVREIATAMGGRVEAESELGRGSRFAVVLPLAVQARS